MQTLTKYEASLFVALTSAALASCGGNSSSNNDDSSGAASTGGVGGNGATGVTSAGSINGINGTSNTSSSAAITTGSTVTGDVGGSGGTASTAGGAGGSEATSVGGLGGTSGAAGETTVSDSGGTSGSSGSGGEGGSGGIGPTGVIGVLGEPCDSPGVLACAGNHQRVSLICNDGAWEVNETCAENHACDTTPGVGQGTCRAQLSECIDQEPGHGVCEDSTTLSRCGPDNVTLELVECEGSCVDGACDDRPNSCPAESFINCGSECGGLSASCSEGAGCEGKPLVVLLMFDAPSQIRVVRMGDFDALCSMACESSQTRGLSLVARTEGDASSSFRVTVPPPWRIGTSVGYCFEDATEGCRVFGPGGGPGNGDVLLGTVLTNDPDASEQNILIESADEGEVLECP